MSFLLQAPYPALITTTLLPSPNWGDSVALKGTVTSMRSVDGTLYTYVKTKGARRHSNGISSCPATRPSNFVRSWKPTSAK
jgi:hypothetical protein